MMYSLWFYAYGKPIIWIFFSTNLAPDSTTSNSEPTSFHAKVFTEINEIISWVTERNYIGTISAKTLAI